MCVGFGTDLNKALGWPAQREINTDDKIFALNWNDYETGTHHRIVFDRHSVEDIWVHPDRAALVVKHIADDRPMNLGFCLIVHPRELIWPRSLTDNDFLKHVSNLQLGQS